METLTTPWQAHVQQQIDELAEISLRKNKTITLEIPEGEYDFYSLRVKGHVSLKFGSGYSRSVRLRYIGKGDQTLITLPNGYGNTISGLELLSKSHVRNLVGVRFEGTINGAFENARIDLRGVNNIGIQIAGRESLVIQRVEARAAIPLHYVMGDNIIFRDLDLGSITRTNPELYVAENFPQAIVLLHNMPNQLRFEGYQTWQGGKHAVYGKINSRYTGQNLSLSNVRWEQAYLPDEEGTYAIHLEYLDRALENFSISDSRWTTRKNGIYVTCPPGTALVPRVSLFASYLPGDRIIPAVQ